MPSDSSQQRIADLERFAAVVAHEFQAPLVTLQGFLGGLEATAKDGDWDRFQNDVSRIQQLSQELRTTVDVLLRLAKGEVNPQAGQSVSLAQAANEAVELLEGTLSKQPIVISISPDLPSVAGDAVLWRSVYQNLIANAAKACAGVANAKIDIGCEHFGGERICFVRDNGRGHDPQEAARLFELSNLKAGLGLQLVRRIIELYGGNVWAEVNEEVGITVKWKLGS